MSKFIIERQYLVPVYQHILVEANNLEQACELAVGNEIDWQGDEVDYENARATTVRLAKLAPDDVNSEHDLVLKYATTFANFLYSKLDNGGGDGDLLRVPEKYTEED
jgi:hypothetical protein